MGKLFDLFWLQEGGSIGAVQPGFGTSSKLAGKTTINAAAVDDAMRRTRSINKSNMNLSSGSVKETHRSRSKSESS